MRQWWAIWFAATLPLAAFAPSLTWALLIVTGILATALLGPATVRRRIFPLWTSVAALALVAAIATFGPLV